MARRKSYKAYNNPISNRIKNPEQLTTDYYSAKATITELQQVRRRLAKMANQRLVRLEGSYSTITGESFASYGAAEIAKEYLSSRGRRRYSEQQAVYKDANTLKYEISHLQSFLTSKSSTPKGQRTAETERVETFVKKGIDRKTAASKDFYDFLKSKLYSDYTALFKSETVIGWYDSARVKAGADTAREKLQDIYNEYQSKGGISLKAVTAGLQSLK